MNLLENLKKNKPIRALVKPVYDATLRKVLNSYRYWIFRNEKTQSKPENPVELSAFFVQKNGFLLFDGRRVVEPSLAKLLKAYPEVPWFVFIETDAILSGRAETAIQRSIALQPDCDLLYTDVDCLTETMRRTDPWFKPDFNLFAFRTENLLRPLCVVRRDLLERVAEEVKDDETFNWAEMTFRMVESASKIVHLPEIGAHYTPACRADDPERLALENDAIRAHLRRNQVKAEVLPLRSAPFRRVRYQRSTTPLVSILIPNKDQVEMLSRAITSIRAKTTYPNYEILVIENNSVTSEIETCYRELEVDTSFPGCVLRYADRFNYSKINNFGAAQAKGEIFVFLNNDTEVLSPGWLEELVALAEREEVGAVGPKLLFPDRRIQHAGCSYGSFKERWMFHVFEGSPESAAVYRNGTRKMTPVLAVTGACLVMKRSLFEEIGGFPEDLPVVYNDIELCFMAYERGKTNLFTPYARLIHDESATRGADMTREQIAAVKANFRTLTSRHEAIAACPDPFYSVNLTFDQYFMEKIK